MPGTEQAGILATALAMFLSLFAPVPAETTAPVDLALEETFLDVLPKIEIPDDIQLIPGVVSEEFRNCEVDWPVDYEKARSGPEARALRDIYGLVRTRNIISTKDCSCAVRGASWEKVELVAGGLRKQHDVERLSWQQTRAVAEEADRLTAIAETMCGGSF